MGAPTRPPRWPEACAGHFDTDQSDGAAAGKTRRVHTSWGKAFAHQVAQTASARAYWHERVRLCVLRLHKEASTSTSLAALRCVPLSPLAAQSPWQAAAKAKGGETPRRRFLIYYKACSTWAALLCGAIMAWLRPRTPLCRAGWGPARASSCARASVSAARQQRRGARPCASPLRSVCRVALTRIDSRASTATYTRRGA